MVGPGRRVAALLVLLVAACDREDYHNAELQLDVDAPLPDDAGSVRICVAEAGVRTVGAAGSRYSIPAIPTGRPAVLVVDVLQEVMEDTAAAGDFHVLARVGPVTLDTTRPYALEPLLEAGGTLVDAGDLEAAPLLQPCVATGTFAEEEEDAWLIAVRFAE